MNISEEIKRMLSLLESELGNVKPLITEEGDGTGVETDNTPEGILKRAINTGCWADKKYTYSDGAIITPDPKDRISTVNENYLYALNKIDPNIKAGDKFVKLKANGIDVYMFGTPTTNPQYPGAYLAVARSASIPTFDKTKPNQNYLESHGWNCATFSASANPTSQETQMSAEQVNIVNAMTKTDDFVRRIGGNVYTTKAFGEDRNYQTIDLATGKDVVTGEQLFNAQDMAAIKNANFSPAGKYFVYKVAGTNTSRTNVADAVESALNYLGYTTQEPSKVLGGKANSDTTVGQLCDTLMRGRCNTTILDYKEKNPNQKLWRMDEAQKAAYEAETGTKVFDQKSMISGLEATRGELRRAGRDSKNDFANRKYCNSAIDILTYCSTYSTLQDTSRCEDYMKNMEERGIITFPNPEDPFEAKIIALKTLLNDCAIGVQNKEINIANKYETKFVELQKSTGPYGMRTATPTPASKKTEDRGGMKESLNNSINSVITEAINKNNNKNLDSIIKKNLRKYIG
jgi:hypothetical protein